MKKDSVVFTLMEVMEVMDAKSLADIRRIKSECPTSRVQNVSFSHGDIEDEVPF
mgnify:FL=1